MLQDEERDPLLHSFSHLKEVLNNITRKSPHLSRLLTQVKEIGLINCRDRQTFSVEDYYRDGQTFSVKVNIFYFTGHTNCATT